MLATFQGVVERGQVRWIGTAPPDGAKVVVVAQILPAVEEQLNRLRALSDQEWRQPFDELVKSARDDSWPEAEVSAIGDQELVDVVHGIRAEIKEERQHVGSH